MPLPDKLWVVYKRSPSTNSQERRTLLIYFMEKLEVAGKNSCHEKTVQVSNLRYK